jgi:WD repeat-containing protein 35
MGEHKKAVDCCVLLNHWNIAIEMAEKYGFIQVEGLLHQNANELLNKNKRLEAAELYRKANRNTEAAKILSGIADQLIDRDSKPLYIKKLYVMAALEVDLYKKRLVDATMTGQNATTAQVILFFILDFGVIDY